MRRLAELLNPRVAILLDGRWWPLVLTHGVLIEVGRELGCDALTEIPIAQGSARVLRAVLWAALARAGAGWELADVGRLITRGNLGQVRKTIEAAWLASMPEPAKKGKDPEPSPRGRPLTQLRAWAIARMELGLSDEEWIEMTPRQLHALSQARESEMQREELLVGILASTVANFSDRAPRRPLAPAAFMIHRFEEPEQTRGGVTGEDLMLSRAIARRKRQRSD